MTSRPDSKLARSDRPSSSGSTVAPAPELNAPGTQGLSSTHTGLDTVSEFDIDAILSSINLPTFLPSIGGEDGGYNQSPPIQWDDLDFSWLQQPAGTDDLPLDGGDMNGDEEVVGTDEIDEATSQHLLWLFFSRQRTYVLEMNIARFYHRIKSDEPGVRPHDSLIYAIYAVAAPSSPLAHIRAKERAFYRRSASSIDVALSSNDGLRLTLFDVTRAATLLAGWLWGHFEDAAAIIMTAKAVRCGIGCRLDQISTSKWKKEKEREYPLRRNRPRFCPPPLDQIDLAERIYAFWALWAADVCAAIATRMPAGIDSERVTTPLPFAWSVFEHADQMRAALSEERTMQGAMDGGLKGASNHADLSYLIQSLYLLHRSITVPLLSASLPVDVSVSESGAALGPHRDRLFAQQTSNALSLFSESLPAELKSRHHSGSLSSSAAVLHFITGSAQVFLHDTNSYRPGNDIALYHAGGVVGLIKLMGQVDVEDMGMFIYCLWSMVVSVLIRESKRLKRDGRDIDATVVDANIDAVLSVLRKKEKSDKMAHDQAQLLMILREGPPSDDEDEGEVEVEPLSVVAASASSHPSEASDVLGGM
ncbi:hypothetical protein JCM24511_08923 [Saitozyma sp. JCM 24511]|nr:hypothetical protein JCM24511_08923 [Saitozyma sp. JCM 24511]